MKKFNKNKVYKEISKFQKAIEKSIDKDILAQIIEDIIRRLDSDILPSDWFFKSAKVYNQKYAQEQKRSSKKSKEKELKETLIQHSSKIRLERDEIKYTIEQFWELPDNIKEVLLDRWPSEYRIYINKEPIDTGDEMIDNYTATYIADIILAKRYKSTPGTIYKYAGEK